MTKRYKLAEVQKRGKFHKCALLADYDGGSYVKHKEIKEMFLQVLRNKEDEGAWFELLGFLDICDSDINPKTKQ